MKNVWMITCCVLLLLGYSFNSSSQTIVSIDPDSVYTTSDLPVFITGSGTSFGQGSTTMYIANGNDTIRPDLITSGNFGILSTTSLFGRLDIPANATLGDWNLHVNNTIDGNMMVANGVTVIDRNTPSPAPAIIYPISGTTFNTNQVQINWLASDLAYVHKVVVKDSSTMITTWTSFASMNADSIIPPALPNGTYMAFMASRGIEHSTGWSSWSDTVYFTISASSSVVSVLPNTGQQGEILNVTVTGTNTIFKQGTATFRLENGTDTIYPYSYNALSEQALIGTINIPANATLGFWDVVVDDAYSYANLIVAAFEVIVPDPIPAAPTLLLPADASVENNYTPLFDWTEPTYAAAYEIMVDDNIGFGSPEFTIDSVLPSQVAPDLQSFLQDGTYYWKVRARNAAQQWGAWSPVWTVTIQAVPQLASITPNNADQGDQLSVQITGISTYFASGSPTSFFLEKGNNTIYPQVSGQNITENVIDCIFDIPANAAWGYWDVRVDDGIDGSLVLTDGFYINPAACTTQCGTVIGRVINTGNGNCQDDGGEIGIHNAVVRADPGPHFFSTDFQGYYSADLPAGNYTLTYQPASSLWADNCGTQPVTVIASTTSPAIDFESTPSSICPVLQVSTGVATLRRCFNTNLFSVNYCNAGSGDAYDVWVEVEFPVNMLPVNNNVWDSISGNKFYLHHDTIFAEECYSLATHVEVTCAANLGDTLCIDASINSINTPCGVVNSQVQHTYCGVVIGSYDPNDKWLYSPFLTDSFTYIDTMMTLQYQVNFQNTGNDTAFTVVVRDTLSAYLDLVSVIPGASSHNYIFEIEPPNILKWTFNNILLVDSNANEPASHGFITYRVDQLPGIPYGAQIHNRAAIYFDFNAPVITNNVICELNDLLTLPSEMELIAGPHVNVYPNPFSSVTTFDVHKWEGENNFQLLVFDLSGKLVYHQQGIRETRFQWHSNELDKGMYIYRIIAEGSQVGAGKLLIQK
jgi:uncharacterized repeat protein (TIGR01451 family)